MPYCFFVSCFVFLELGYRIKKQFLKYLPLLGISGDFEHGPVVLKRSVDQQSAPPTSAVRPLELDQCSIVRLNSLLRYDNRMAAHCEGSRPGRT